MFPFHPWLHYYFSVFCMIRKSFAIKKLFEMCKKNILNFFPPKGLQLSEKIVWVGGKPPIAEPECGFRGEKCISYAREISASIAGVILLVLTIVSLVLYRNWRYEQELDSLLWKIDFKDIQMHENESTAAQKQTRATHPLIRTSQVSLSSNPDADFRYSTIFTPIGLYKSQLYAIKKIRKKSVDITREMKMELKIVSLAEDRSRPENHFWPFFSRSPFSYETSVTTTWMHLSVLVPNHRTFVSSQNTARVGV